MAKSKLRLGLALLLLAVSLVLLLWGYLPLVRESRSMLIPPADLQLPPPEGWLPLLLEFI
jgi:hypothetical protein